MFEKTYTPNRSEDVLLIEKSQKYCFVDTNMNVYEKELQKENQAEFRTEKAIKGLNKLII